MFFVDHDRFDLGKWKSGHEKLGTTRGTELLRKERLHLNSCMTPTADCCFRLWNGPKSLDDCTTKASYTGCDFTQIDGLFDSKDRRDQIIPSYFCRPEERTVKLCNNTSSKILKLQVSLPQPSRHPASTTYTILFSKKYLSQQFVPDSQPPPDYLAESEVVDF